jgi:hypothetical protein
MTWLYTGHLMLTVIVALMWYRADRDREKSAAALSEIRARLEYLGEVTGVCKREDRE